MLDPKYDEDVVNLRYLKKVINQEDDNLQLPKSISRNYGSKPQPPYYKGDTWLDGTIVYTCINDRLIGTYQNSDWTTESGAKEEAERKSKIFLAQPSDYNIGDMWILQSDNAHSVGKKGEILISEEKSKTYKASHWKKMLEYGTSEGIKEVADDLNITKEGIEAMAVEILELQEKNIQNDEIIQDLLQRVEVLEEEKEEGKEEEEGEV